VAQGRLFGENIMTTTIRLDDWVAEQMKDPEFRAAMEALEPAYQIGRMRMLRGLTQEQLAERLGTSQSSIARLESGRTEPRLSFLRRVAQALDARLEVRLVPAEENQAEQPGITASGQEQMMPLPRDYLYQPAERDLVAHSP
jgi:transcriptional regulator with XRE-family HTH domain